MSFGEQRREGTSDSASDMSLLNALHFAESTDTEVRIDMDSEAPSTERKPSTFGRVELIERLKRTKSPLWSQRQDVSHVGDQIRWTGDCLYEHNGNADTDP
jgi:hypothetical protein